MILISSSFMTPHASVFVDDLLAVCVDPFDQRPPLKVVQYNVPLGLLYVFQSISPPFANIVSQRGV